MRARTRLSIGAICIVGLGMTAALQGCQKELQSERSTDTVLLSDKLTQYEELTIDATSILEQVRTRRNGVIELQLGLTNHPEWVFELTVVDDGANSELYVDDVLQPVQEIYTLRGYKRGSSEPCLVTLSSRWFSAIIIDGEEEVYIDPLSEFLPGADPATFIVYRSRDVKLLDSESCGVESTTPQSEPLPAPLSVVERSYTCMKIPMTLVADIEFSAAYGNNSTTIASKMVSAMNSASLCYWQNSDPRLLLDMFKQKQFIYTTIQGFSSTNYSTLLSQFRSWGNANVSARRSTLNMLFSGKSALTVGGLAYSMPLLYGSYGSGPACTNPSYSYCFVKRLSTSSQQRVAVAHEAAHLMGHEPHIAGTIMSSTNEAYNYNHFGSLWSYSYIINHMWNEQCFSSQGTCN